MTLPLPESDLRGLIREVLRELVRDEVARALATLPATGPTSGGAARVPTSSASARSAGSSPTPLRHLGGARTGVITERVVEAAARAGDSTITIARGTAVTPLARDRARRLGIRIEKE